MVVDPLHIMEQPLMIQVPDVTLLMVEGNSSSSGLQNEMFIPLEIRRELKVAHLCMVTPNSIEPDHLACNSEISTSNSSPSFKGRLDITTLWLKSDSGLHNERGGDPTVTIIVATQVL